MAFRHGCVLSAKVRERPARATVCSVAPGVDCPVERDGWPDDSSTWTWETFTDDVTHGPLADSTGDLEISGAKGATIHGACVLPKVVDGLGQHLAAVLVAGASHRGVGKCLFQVRDELLDFSLPRQPLAEPDPGFQLSAFPTCVAADSVADFPQVFDSMNPVQTPLGVGKELALQLVLLCHRWGLHRRRGGDERVPSRRRCSYQRRFASSSRWFRSRSCPARLASMASAVADSDLRYAHPMGQ